MVAGSRAPPAAAEGGSNLAVEVGTPAEVGSKGWAAAGNSSLRALSLVRRH